MAITDSGTALNTTYTEQSVVSFTTGVLSSLADCVTEVETKLRRGTLGASTSPTSTQVQNWIKRAKLKLMSVKSFTYARKYGYATLSAGDYRVSLPDDFNGNAKLRDTTNDRYIQVVGNDLIDKMYPDISAENRNEPIAATVKNMELWIVPPVDASTVLEIEYDRSGAETTADSMAWLPEFDRFLCCDFAVGESFLSLHMWQEAAIYMNRWNEEVGWAMKADGKRKWSHRRSAINVFQEHNMLGYQPSRNNS